MITERRVILVTTSTRVAEELSKFEALTRVSADSKDVFEKECTEVWSCNKTPFVCRPQNSEQVSCKEINVPDELFNDAQLNADKVPYKAFVDWCYSHRFEPGEYQTGAKINTRKETCILCTIVNHKAIAQETADYNREVSNEVDCIIYESRNFVVLCELGALKPGYLMIVPKTHKYLSIAQIDDDYIMTEYMEVCHDVEYILKGAFGQEKTVSFFEHGSGPSGFTSHPKSIVHAHTHVVIDWTLRKEYMEMLQMRKMPDIRAAANTHYFAYKEGANGMRYCCCDDKVYVQRQFPRQVMAQEAGYTREQYNWRHYAFSDNVHATMYRIWEYLVKNWSKINPRVAGCTAAFVSGYGERSDLHE